MRQKQSGGGDAGDPPTASGVIEEGAIEFFYRPKVGVEEANSLDEVQRFFMLLRPRKPGGTKNRLCVIGKKRMPSARKHERFFGFVQASSENAEELREGLGPQQYETKTRGTRHLAAARLVGSGTYQVVDAKDHATLLYRLELPATPGEAQTEFMIGEVGSYIFSAKNPKGRGPDDPGLADKAEFPKEKQEEFQQYSWIPVRDTQLLDFPHCEFLLVGAMDADLKHQVEQLEEASRRHKEATHCEEGEEALLNAMKEEVQAEKLGLNTEPVEDKQLV